MTIEQPPQSPEETNKTEHEIIYSEIENLLETKGIVRNTLIVITYKDGRTETGTMASVIWDSETEPVFLIKKEGQKLGELTRVSRKNILDINKASSE